MIRSNYARPLPSSRDIPLTRLKPNSLRVWTGYGTVLALYALLLVLFQSEPVPLTAVVLDLLLTAICLLPTALWYKNGQQGLPAFELICISYAVQYASPVWLQPNQVILHSLPVRFSWDETLQALIQATVGVTAMLLGYYLIRLSKFSHILPALDLPLQPGRRSLYLVFGTSIGIVCSLVTLSFGSAGIGSAFGSLIGLGTNQLYVVIVLLGYLAYGADSNSARYGLAFYSAIALATILGLATGLLENAFIPLAIGFIIRWQSKGKLPIAAAIIAILVFAVLNSVKSDYRAEAWYGTADTSFSSRLTLWYDKASSVVTSIASGDILEGLRDTIHKTTPRLDLLHLLSLVNRITPQYVPYYEGKTYSYFLVGWVPRILWPDKPEANEANITVALDYNILESFQTSSTSVGIGQIAEAYANFSILGIIIVMALQGFILACLDRMLNRSSSEGGRAVYLALMVFFFNGIGTSTAALFGALVQNVIANVLIVRLFSSGFTRPTAKSGTKQVV